MRGAAGGGPGGRGADSTLAAMSRPAAPRGGFTTRVVVGLVLLLVAWLVIRTVLGMVYSLIRAAIFVALFVIVAWIVLVGPPGRD